MSLKYLEMPENKKVLQYKQTITTKINKQKNPPKDKNKKLDGSISKGHKNPMKALPIAKSGTT